MKKKDYSRPVMMVYKLKWPTLLKAISDGPVGVHARSQFAPEEEEEENFDD